MQFPKPLLDKESLHEHPTESIVDGGGGGGRIGGGDEAPVVGRAHASQENRFPVDLLLIKSLQVEGSFT